MAGEPGFEPGLTESESVGLPLTYSPAGSRISFYDLNRDADRSMTLCLSTASI